MKILFLLGFLQINLSVNAQNYQYKNWTVSDGLSSNEIHSISLKSDGEMLIGTDNGVQIFDGNQFFKVAAVNDKYSSITAFSIDKMEDEVIWIKSYSNGLFKLINDSLRPYEFNTKIFEESKSHIGNYRVLKNGRLYYTYHKPGYPFVYAIDKQGEFKKIKIESYQKSELTTKYGFEVDDRVIFTLSAPDKKYFDENISSEKDVFKKFQSDIDYFDESFFRRNTFVSNIDGEYVAFNDNVLRFDNNGNITGRYTLDARVIRLLRNENRVYALTFSGVKVLSAQSGKFDEAFLKGIVVSDMLWDKDGGTWFATTEKGLFYLASTKIQVPELDSPLVLGNLHRISAYGNHLLTLHLNSELHLYRYANQKYNLTSSFLGFEDHVSHYLRLEESKFYLNFTKGFIKDGQLTVKHIDKYHQIGNDIITTSNSTYLIASNNRGVVKLLPDGQSDYFNSDDTVRFPAYSLAQFGDSIIVGLKDGLARFTNGKYTYIHSAIISSPVLAITTWGENLVVGTKGQGLFIISSGSLMHYSTDNGLISNNIQSLCVSDNNKLWVGTTGGLSILNSHLKIINLNEDDGLPAKGIIDLAYANGRVNVLTALGFCYLDTAISKPKANFDITLILPIINKVLKAGNYMVLPLGKRDAMLNISENSLKYNSGFNFKVIYRNDTLNAPNGNISLAGLQPGNHELKVLAGLKGVFPIKEAVFTLVVPAYYYEENWFVALMVAIGIGLVSLVVLYFLKQAEFNRVTKMKTATAQYEALNLQINPHFLFNSLNNIQILSSNDPRSRINQFVGKLSKLTRNVLENSKYTTITLLEELENIKRFIDIENIRFQERPVHFNMQVDPKLDLEKLTVPPMILQPSVENSIWHGLLPKESGDRRLEMKVQEISSGFMVIVNDNGIGWRNKQPKAGTEVSKTSIGLKNTIERLRMYEDMNLGKASLKLEEISNANGEFCGVQVSFLFYPKFILP